MHLYTSEFPLLLQLIRLMLLIYIEHTTVIGGGVTMYIAAKTWKHLDSEI